MRTISYKRVLNARAGRPRSILRRHRQEQHPELEELVTSVRFPDACGHIQKIATPVVDVEVD